MKYVGFSDWWTVQEGERREKEVLTCDPGSVAMLCTDTGSSGGGTGLW